MWWNDIDEIKDWMSRLTDRLVRIDNNIVSISGVIRENTEITYDKIGEYMENVDKLNGLINEFKGCVSIARATIEERKQMTEAEAKTAVLADITKEIYKAMLSFIQASEKLESKAHYKIDAIYKAVCEKEEKKPSRKRKTVKKHD